MPVLNWIGKEAVVKHHREVPFRLLEPVPELSLVGPDSPGSLGSDENLIVQGVICMRLRRSCRGMRDR